MVLFCITTPEWRCSSPWGCGNVIVGAKRPDSGHPSRIAHAELALYILADVLHRLFHRIVQMSKIGP